MLQKANQLTKHLNYKTMDKKTLGILSYITIIGWAISYVKNNPKDEYVSFHVRQSLGIIILSLALYIPYMIVAMVVPSIAMIFSLVYLVILVLWIIGLMGALNNQKKLIPVVGEKIQSILKSI